MALSAFDDKSHPPQPAELKRVLGKTAPLWDELIARITGRFAPVTQLWSFSGEKYGWSLRLRQRDRVIVYMTPQAGSFQVGLVLGDRALKAARELALPSAIVALIDSARKYAEGTGLRIPVSNKADVTAVEYLAACKMTR